MTPIKDTETTHRKKKKKKRIGREVQSMESGGDGHRPRWEITIVFKKGLPRPSPAFFEVSPQRENE